MIITCIVLFSLLAAGASALAVRTAFRALRWMFRVLRVLLGLSVLAVTVFYCFPRLFGGGKTAEG